MIQIIDSLGDSMAQVLLHHRSVTKHHTFVARDMYEGEIGSFEKIGLNTVFKIFV